MTQPRAIIAGRDTPDDYTPATILAAMGVPSLGEDPGPGLTARVLFLPSFHPEVYLTIQRTGEEATVSLVTLQTNLWYRRSYELQAANGNWPAGRRAPREPERWEEARTILSARFAVFAEQLAALRVHEEPPPQAGGLDGLTVFGQLRDPAGKPHDFDFWFREPERPRSQFVRRVYELAVELLQDERGVRVLESLHGYLHLGLPVKHQPGRPYVLRIFGRLSYDDLRTLGASLEQVPEDVPLLLGFSNFDGMGTVLYETFREFLRRSGPTACWTSRDHARTQLEEIGVPASAIFAEKEEALDALREV